ncbi:MAG TPA: aspartate aminotransferase family protein [Acidimicrobiales bacterium]|nr:aspartate aminotransferase family protein [Acidimicrobiales bacterium]
MGEKTERLDGIVARAQRLVETEEPRYRQRTARSFAATREASAHMPMGLPASGQVFGSSALVAAHAAGAYLDDIDGNHYLDFNMGYGALLVGHAHPVVVDAVRRQLERGTVFLMPCEENTTVARSLSARFGQPMWRFTNSGSETTMPAIRAARSFTGRDRIVKTEGAYHGQYDSVLVSLKPPLSEAGPASHPVPVPSSTGIPPAYLSCTTVVAFNDLESLGRELEAGDISCVIVEPALQNIGIVMPDPGYLAGVRELCDATGTLLVFDEVKIGITAHWGGASTLFGVRPDLVCVSKSIGGGLPLGAFGGRADVMNEVRPGRVTHVGTFSGNPLAMAAAEATLEKVCTPAATTAVIERANRLADGCEAVIGTYELPGHVVRMGARGCITWRPKPARNYRDTLDIQTPIAKAQWLWCINRGILLPPGLDSQWLVSMQHTDCDIADTISVFSEFAAALAA